MKRELSENWAETGDYLAHDLGMGPGLPRRNRDNKDLIRNLHERTISESLPGQSITSIDPVVSYNPSDRNVAGREIRLVRYSDPSTLRNRPHFDPITRIVNARGGHIQLERYSDFPDGGDGPTSWTVGFKSKVVSRKHARIFLKDNEWYLKDVGSSSGTFLNRMRLSKQGEESPLFHLVEGDIIQLGIDYSNETEPMFGCVQVIVYFPEDIVSYNAPAAVGGDLRRDRDEPPAEEPEGNGFGRAFKNMFKTRK